MSTTFRPPLTREQLHEIGVEQNPADINRLLWEIKRLRAIVLRADQLQRSLGATGGGAGAILQCLRNDLASEPCVLEQARLDDPPPGQPRTIRP